MSAVADSAPCQKTLVCEGYLLKRRGAFQNRTRWFRLTTTHIEYYTAEEGEPIASLALESILRVTDEGGLHFEIVQREPLGASGRTRMLLQTKATPEKKKWMTSIKEMIQSDTGSQKADEFLVCEGYLTKLRGARKTRWFRLTNCTLSYYTENGGTQMSCLTLEGIEAIKSIDDLTFKVHGDREFTASKKRDMTLKADYKAIKRKWMNAFKRLQGEGQIRVKY
eukprot:m.11165 g.11165  ORF g.11165 m.11165 type:complete len:223 (+) comp23036_c0_seq3:18-686(+)